MLSHRSKKSTTGRLRRGAAGTGLLVAALVGVAACGGGSSKTAALPAPALRFTVPPAAVAAGTTSLGSVAVDSSGRTLYRFDKDKPGSTTSACNGVCATTWPPALVSGQLAGGPSVAGTIGFIPRTDGSHQVTLDGHPLYRYSGDQAPGDTNGNGFAGIWHVLATNGGAAGGVTPSTAASGASGY